jgi:hypothetical protein
VVCTQQSPLFAADGAAPGVSSTDPCVAAAGNLLVSPVLMFCDP